MNESSVYKAKKKKKDFLKEKKRNLDLVLVFPVNNDQSPHRWRGEARRFRKASFQEVCMPRTQVHSETLEIPEIAEYDSTGCQMT